MSRAQQVSELDQLVTSLNKMANIVTSDEEWELVYSRVFSESRTISSMIDNLGYRQIKYYDPDSSYEEDVRAYLEAATEHVDKIKKFEGMLD